MTTIDLGLPQLGGLAGVPTFDGKQTAKEYKTDQEVRWCPGCGDYAVLAAVQSFLPELGLKRENIVFVSGARRDRTTAAVAGIRAVDRGHLPVLTSRF